MGHRTPNQQPTTRTHHQHRLPMGPNRHTHNTRQPHQHKPHRRRNRHPQRMHPTNQPHRNQQQMTNPLKKLTTKNPKPKTTNTNKTTDTHPTNTNWTKKANCKNQTHHMFPQHHKDITYIQTARQICSTCTVQQQCLNYALEFPPADMHGVWAGLTSRQLAAKQKQLGIKATRPTLAQTWGDTQ